MIDKDNNIVFVHIPKTAGQSITLELDRTLDLKSRNSKDLLMGKNANGHPGPAHLDHCTYLEILNYSGISEKDISKFFKFSFVRDPLDRAFSIYKFWGSEEDSFTKFVNKELLGRLWEEQYYFVKPQAEFVINEFNKPALDFIGKVENISNDWNKIREELNHLELGSLEHKNSSNGINYKIPKNFTGLKYWFQSGSNKIKRHIKGPNHLRETDANIKASIYRIYEKDYDLFGY